MPIASGAISSGRPSEWPKPGRSIATTRPAPDTRSQILRYAQRLSGHGLNINTVTADESALLSANRIRTPSQTRKSGAMGEYPARIHMVRSSGCCIDRVESQPMTTVIEGAADDSSLR